MGTWAGNPAPPSPCSLTLALLSQEICFPRGPAEDEGPQGREAGTWLRPGWGLTKSRQPAVPQASHSGGEAQGSSPAGLPPLS